MITISGINDEKLQEMCMQTVENRAYGKKRSGRIYEHQLRMIQKVGRPLVQGEVIHHMNGVRDDNRIENLEITNQRDHIKNHKQLLIRIAELEKLVKTKSELIREYEKSAEMTDSLRK